MLLTHATTTPAATLAASPPQATPADDNDWKALDEDCKKLVALVASGDRAGFVAHRATCSAEVLAYFRYIMHEAAQRPP